MITILRQCHHCLISSSHIKASLFFDYLLFHHLVKCNFRFVAVCHSSIQLMCVCVCVSYSVLLFLFSHTKRELWNATPTRQFLTSSKIMRMWYVWCKSLHIFFLIRLSNHKNSIEFLLSFSVSSKRSIIRTFGTSINFIIIAFVVFVLFNPWLMCCGTMKAMSNSA